MKATLLQLLACLPCAVSCEQAIQVEGTVSVPNEVQTSFSEAEPGRVVLSARYARGGVIEQRALFVLCSAKDEPLTLPFHLAPFGCAQEIIVEAFAEPLPAGEPRACGVTNGPALKASMAAALAGASKTVFPGQSGSPCRSDSAQVSLTLSPMKMRVAD
jgi:hypothetical protein